MPCLAVSYTHLDVYKRQTLLCVFTEDSGDIQRVAALWHEVLY